MPGFEGLWKASMDKATGQVLETFTIITTDPNELMKPAAEPVLHDRIPVILSRRDYVRWLAPCDPAQLPIDVLRRYPAEEMTAWKVGSDVGNVRNNRPDLIAAI